MWGAASGGTTGQLDGSNKGHQMLQRMGWRGAGLGVAHGHMGGLELFVLCFTGLTSVRPHTSHNYRFIFRYIKFCCSGANPPHHRRSVWL